MAVRLRTFGRWLRVHVASSPGNILLTALCVALLVWLIPPLLRWAVFDATWRGDSRSACTGEGACWVFIKMRFGQLLYGFYPEAERWRPNIVGLSAALLVGWLLLPRLPRKAWVAGFGLTVFPVVAFWLLKGGYGLREVDTTQWGGVMLTLLIASVGITASLPLGVVLALARRSELRLIRWLAVAFIELWRGIPLITVLFMASVMLPLFLPAGTQIDKLLRALVGVTLFASAYMAEVVRGGLQSISRGQWEASQALGLSYPTTVLQVILPQALRLVIPGIVNTFIGLFKDTTLVAIIGMLDVLGMVQAASTDPQWLGSATEGYVAAALFYGVINFAMSRYSQSLEVRGNHP